MYFTFKAVAFPERTHVAKGKRISKKMKGVGIEEPMEDLPLYIDANHSISCWKCSSFVARIYFLFTGKIWITVSGQHPATSVGIGDMFKFTYKDEKKGRKK